MNIMLVSVRERTREIKLRSPPPSASMHATPGTSAEIEAVKKFSRSSVSIADICCRSCCFMYLPRQRAEGEGVWQRYRGRGEGKGCGNGTGDVAGVRWGAAAVRTASG